MIFSHLCLAKTTQKGLGSDRMENEYNFLLLVGRKEILIWAEYYYIYIYIYINTHTYITSSISLPFYTEFGRQKNGVLHGKSSTSPFSFPFYFNQTKEKACRNSKVTKSCSQKARKTEVSSSKDNKWYTDRIKITKLIYNLQMVPHKNWDFLLEICLGGSSN